MKNIVTSSSGQKSGLLGTNRREHVSYVLQRNRYHLEFLEMLDRYLFHCRTFKMRDTAVPDMKGIPVLLSEICIKNSMNPMNLYQCKSCVELCCRTDRHRVLPSSTP